MKNLLIFILVALFSYSAVEAQNDILRFGIKGGPNYSKLIYDVPGYEPDNEYRFGWHVGVELEIPIFQNFSFQPELIYSDQGDKYSINVEGEEETMFTKLSYLNLPLLAKYYLFEGLSIEAGPQFGLNIDAKSKIKDGDKTDLEDIKDLDMGLNAGLGYQFDVGLFLEGRYYRGFTNLYDVSNNNDFKIFNNLFQLSVGYTF